MVLADRPEISPGDLSSVSEAELRFVVARAVNLVRRDLDCSPQEAVAAICRDWLELRQIPILSDNELSLSTPVDFKPTFLDRIKKHF